MTGPGMPRSVRWAKVVAGATIVMAMVGTVLELFDKVRTTVQPSASVWLRRNIGDDR